MVGDQSGVVAAGGGPESLAQHPAATDRHRTFNILVEGAAGKDSAMRSHASTFQGYIANLSEQQVSKQ